MTFVVYSLTISTSLLMTQDMILIDVNGKPHHFSEKNLRWMIGTGWIFYLTSLIGTVSYYKIHPSFSDIREAIIVIRTL